MCSTNIYQAVKLCQAPEGIVLKKTKLMVLEFTPGEERQGGARHAINTYLSGTINSLLLILTQHRHHGRHLCTWHRLDIDRISENRGPVGTPRHRQIVFERNRNIVPKKKKNEVKRNSIFKLSASCTGGLSETSSYGKIQYPGIRQTLDPSVNRRYRGYR